MRLVLKKGKQKRLIELAKGGGSWANLSEKIGLNSCYLQNELRKEKRKISEKVYFDLCNLANVNFDVFVLQRLDDNWGMKKGGKISPGKRKKLPFFPKESVELAEIFGVLLGDGNINFTKSYKRGSYSLRIVGDLIKDKDYHLGYVKPLLEKVFGMDVKEGRFKSNARYLEIHSIELVNFLISKGLKSGNKIKSGVGIPSWIKSNQRYLLACLRGLYDTDGSFYKITNQNSFQVCFTNYSPVIKKDVYNSLKSVGINCSKISKNDIYITKKSELRKFFKLIGFANLRHLDKVKKYSPVV